MERLSLPLVSRLNLATATLLVAWLSASAWAQNSGKGTVATHGVVTDWSTHHVIFSDPGTLVDAMMKGRRPQWERIVNDPRYRMQQLRRGRPMAGQTATATAGLSRAQEVAPVNSNVGDEAANPRGKRSRGNPSKVDWAENLAPSGSTGGVSEFASPAKYSFINPSTINITNCRDFVVFPVGNISGSSTQASLIGVDNIYGVCTGGPVIRFAYTFEGGEVDNSPVLSLEGTHVAFVESHATGIGGNNAIFHVLKLDEAGATGNGTGFATPAVPGTGNNAADTGTEFQLQGTGIKSGIYVDYSSDTAYVTDDAGFVHKYNPVFEGTPAEITTGWPVSTGETSLSAPVFDGQSQHLFFVGISGTLYCYTTGGTTCGTLVMGGTPNSIQTFVPPIVDSTRGTVFAYGNSLSLISPNVLVQASTTDLSLVSQVSVGSLSGNLARGAFDNAYFTNPDNGHLYVGGGQIGQAGVLALRRVGFVNGTMTTDETNSFVLQTGSAAGAGITLTATTTVPSTGGGNTCTISGFDASTGSPNLMLVGITLQNGSISSVTSSSGTVSNVTPLTGTAGSARLAIYQVTGFITPTVTLTGNFSGANGQVCGAVAFSGVGSVGTSVSTTGTSASASVTGFVSPGSGGITFDLLALNSNTTATTGDSQVPQWNAVGGNSRRGAAALLPPTETATAWTLGTSTLWVEAAVPLIAASPPRQAGFTSLLDVFNTSDSTERLFLGIQNFGFNSGTSNCGGTTCVTSFAITSGTFSTGASATLTYPTATNHLISDIIIDNVSSGGSNIYYGVNNQGIQVTQAALQ